jgi:hypothetical protein
MRTSDDKTASEQHQLNSRNNKNSSSPSSNSKTGFDSGSSDEEHQSGVAALGKSGASSSNLPSLNQMSGKN